MERHGSMTYLLFAYHLVVVTILQQLLSCCIYYHYIFERRVKASIDMLRTIYNTYKPFIMFSTIYDPLQTFQQCCLPSTSMLPSLQISNLRSMSLLLPSIGNYHLVAKCISYSIVYHKQQTIFLILQKKCRINI